MTRRASRVLLVAIAGSLLLATPQAQKLEIHSNQDPGANFAALRTYTWLPSPEVKSEIAPGTLSNPSLSQEVLGPHIVAAVDRELAARGLTRVETGESDVQVVYYAALSVGISGQELGSYYQYTTGWSVVPLGAMPRTTSDIVERGSIVVDIVAPASKKAIWRGTVATRVNQENTLQKRIERVDDGMRRLFERFPRPRGQKPPSQKR